MKKTEIDRTREVHFGKGQGVRLTKSFANPGAEILVRPLGKGKSFTLPVACINQLIESLLELKVLMEDGSEYNSGFMRAALVDGSGREVEVSDLTHSGRGNAIYQARLLIEEIEDQDEQDEQDEDSEEEEDDEEDCNG